MDKQLINAVKFKFEIITFSGTFHFLFLLIGIDQQWTYHTTVFINFSIVSWGSGHFFKGKKFKTTWNPSKHIFLRFRTFKKKKTYFVPDMGLTPPPPRPRLRTCPQLLYVFLRLPLRHDIHKYAAWTQYRMNKKMSTNKKRLTRSRWFKRYKIDIQTPRRIQGGRGGVVASVNLPPPGLRVITSFHIYKISKIKSFLYCEIITKLATPSFIVHQMAPPPGWKPVSAPVQTDTAKYLAHTTTTRERVSILIFLKKSIFS